MIKNILIIPVLFLILLLAGCQSNPGNYDALAACLTQKGAKMYGTEWCSHCKDQKAKFGASFSKVDYIDCDKKPLDCKLAGITGYPTWVMPDGIKLSGAQELETLAEAADCQVPE